MSKEYEVIKAIKRKLYKHISFSNPINKSYYKFLLDNSDEFHPINNEYAIESAIDNADTEELVDATYLCLEEMIESTQAYFANSMNFAIGHPTDKKVVFDAPIMDVAIAITEEVGV